MPCDGYHSFELVISFAHLFANVRIAAIDPADIAAVAAVALTSNSHSTHAYELSGPKASLPAEQVASLARALGRNLRFEALPDSAARKELSKTFSPDFMEAVLRFFATGEFDDSRIVPTVFKITGRQPGTYYG